MRLPRPRYDRLAGDKFLFFARNVENSVPAKNKIDLIRFFMAVDPLILSGFQAIQIAEILRRVEQRYFLHLLIGKSNEFVDVANFHFFESRLL